MPETKVHVIDDDEAMRDSLRFLLETSDLKVETYESASSFLAAVEGGIAGCIVTDVRMPGISGMELVRALQTKGGAPPIIMITGHGDVPLAVEAMKAGVVDFLEKPFDDDALLAAHEGKEEGAKGPREHDRGGERVARVQAAQRGHRARHVEANVAQQGAAHETHGRALVQVLAHFVEPRKGLRVNHLAAGTLVVPLFAHL
jgi:two-component system response regulator FixJ